MPRETKLQKGRRIERLLADYSAAHDRFRKVKRDFDQLKEEVRHVAPGSYGEWERADGTAREVTDMDAVRAHYRELGEEVPTKATESPVIVRRARVTFRGRAG